MKNYHKNAKNAVRYIVHAENKYYTDRITFDVLATNQREACYAAKLELRSMGEDPRDYNISVAR